MAKRHWVMINRAPVLTLRATRCAGLLVSGNAWRMGKISRASVADFLVEQIDDNTCLGKTSLLIN